MRLIGLQAVHLDSPLHDLPENTSIKVEELSISEALQARIMQWDAILQSEESDVEFVKTGRLLARDLQRELGADWKVIYKDNKDVSVPNSIENGDLYWSATDD